MTPARPVPRPRPVRPAASAPAPEPVVTLVPRPVAPPVPAAADETVGAAPRTRPGALTLVGVLVVTAGALLVVLAWGTTAGRDEVARQLPVAIAEGGSGLGLVLVGLALIGISAKRADAALRTRQLTELAALVAALRDER